MSSHIARFPEYDAIVSSSGGDYTSIATALATEGTGKRIYVCSGTYSETEDVMPLTDQSIHFEEADGGVIIDLDTDKKFLMTNASDITLAGRLKVTGTGDSSLYYCLFRVITNVSRINASKCKIIIQPTLTTGLTNHFCPTYFMADYSSWDLSINDWNITGAASKNAQGISINSKFSFYRVLIDTYTYAITTSGYLDGLVLASASACYNSIDIIVNSVTTTGITGRGRGINIVSGASYNSIRGVSRNCDINLLDSGTGNKTTDLAT
ncbi:MAG: hypothetical protein GX444_11795 [Myxococcales bacterium]|nr:hypothetical protein [Myxococcales bacterium]